MKKIAYVINTIVKGGPSRVVINLIENIDKEQFKPILITLFNGNDPKIVNKLKNNGVKVIECIHESRLKYLLSGKKEFEKIIENNKIDIIHSHGFVPDIITSKIKFNGKRISTLHNIMFEDYAFEYGKVKSKIYTKCHIFALKKFDFIVGCSKAVYDAMNQYCKNMTFIRNGIENTELQNTIRRSDLNLPINATIYIYAGHMSELKNTFFLTTNFHKYRNESEYLIMLGDGPNLNNCKKINDSNILFLGFCSEPLKYMNISDIYISASKSEGFSISILEALSCGLGLFLSDIPSHDEVFEIDENCYIGSSFLCEDFEKDFRNFRNQTALLKKEKIIKFKDKFLSAEVMTNTYQKLYK